MGSKFARRRSFLREVSGRGLEFIELGDDALGQETMVPGNDCILDVSSVVQNAREFSRESSSPHFTRRKELLEGICLHVRNGL
jgi:hypothetical protein